MSFKRGGGSNKPQYSISTSVFIRKGKYAKGPSFGLWDADSGPMARGSVKEEYLEDLIGFLKKALSNEQSVSFALFKNKDKRREEDEDDEKEYGNKRREKEEDDEKPARGKRREEEDEKSSKKSGKKSGKKDDWGFDDDD